MPETKPGILRNLRIKRVSLVDLGANTDPVTGDGAHIMLYKQADVEKNPNLSQVHSDAPLDERDEYEKKTIDAASRNSLPDSAFAAVWTDSSGKKQRKLPIHDAGHLAAARGRIDGADIPASVKAEARRKIEAKTNTKKEYTVKNKFMKGLLELLSISDPEARVAKAAELEKAFPDDMEKVAHDPNDPNCKCADCMSKTAAPVDKRFVDMEKAHAELVKSNTELQKQATEAIAIAKAERDTRLNGEMRTMLKSFTRVGIDLDKDVAKFRKLQDSDPETFDRTIAILKSADAQLQDSALYSNVGVSGAAGEGNNAWEQIEALADKQMEKAAEGVTREKMLEKVMLDPKNAKLVKQYRAGTQ